MGHTRLGTIPKTRKWHAVVELMTGLGSSSESLADDLPLIARAALDAAQTGLDKARKDASLRHAFYLLTQIAISCKAPDWRARLHTLGIELPENATAVDLSFGAQDVLDEYISRNRLRSDVSEITQQVFGEAIAGALTPRSLSLFETSGSELFEGLRALATKGGFGELSQSFFARFVSRFLNFYLSRFTAGQLNTNRLPQIGDLSEFHRALELHCMQSARIVRDFSGEWLSKTEFKEGVNETNVARFMSVALKKLRAEMEAQKGDV